MIKFTHDGKWITVELDGEKPLPQTAIRCETSDNSKILETCQKWLDALNLTDVEYQVYLRLH